MIRLLKNITRLDAALARMGEAITPGSATVVVPLADAVGRYAAETLHAKLPVPHFRRSTMDGFAVVARGTVGASESVPALLQLGRQDEQGCVAVLTGAAIPFPYDAVVMQEYTERLSDETVLATRPVASGDNVMDVGEDVLAGSLLISPGERLSPSDIAVLATQGVTAVRVRSFTVGIISTGNEVVPIAAAPQVGQIRDCNAHYLAAFCASRGVTSVSLGIVEDDEAELALVLAAGLAQCDALVLSGGSSAGALDFTSQAILRLPAARIAVHGLAIKPGKPTVLATVGGRLIVGLPGHPLSCAVVAHKALWPLVCLAAGLLPPPAWEVEAELSRAVASVPGRRDFIPVRLERGSAIPLMAKSAAIQVLSQADGLLTLPEECEGYNARTRVHVELWR